MTKNLKLPEICQAAFIQAREQLGLSTKDLGGMACLSTRQIEQIENGETSSFYGAQVKVTAAKKVAKLLKLSEADAFDYGVQAPQRSNVSQAELPIAEFKLVQNSEAQQINQAPTDTVESAQGITENKPVTKVQAKESLLTGVASQSKPASQKKLFLWLSVLAAAVFAVINLQPLFFVDKPEQIIVVKEEIIEPAPPSAAVPVEPIPAVAPAGVTVASANPAGDTAGVCPAEEGVTNYKPEMARKPADMVYVQTKSQQVVCVVDASGKTQNKLLEPGSGVSFFGKPPFKVMTAGLNQVDVYFQGSKVRLPNLNTKTLILEASEVAAFAADRADSQAR